MHKQLKRIKDYDKNLPIVEIYTAVQSAHTDVILVKEVGVILGIQVFTLKKENFHLMTLLRHMMKTLI